MREIVQGARCNGSAFHGLPCPGRLVAVRDPQRRVGAPMRYRCNGPDAHAFEVAAPCDVASPVAAEFEITVAAARLLARM